MDFVLKSSAEAQGTLIDKKSQQGTSPGHFLKKGSPQNGSSETHLHP